MAVLADLPFETLVEILSFLPCSDLASTTRVSKFFRDISQPLLYKAPRLRKPPASATNVVTRPSFQIWFQTLLTPGREPLASPVRSVHLELDTIQRWDYPSNLIQLITTTASNLGIRNPLDSAGAQFMLLLDLLPRLKVLRYTPANGHSSITGFLESAITTGKLPRGLRSLREIDCSHLGTSADVEPRRFRLVLQLPSIHSIKVRSVGNHHISTSGMDAAVATSVVKRITILNGEMSSFVLSQILNLPIALTHFSDSAMADGSFDLRCFMNSLSPLRASLQSLHLDFGELRITSSDEQEELMLSYNEGSLRDWPKLHILRCSLTPLLGKAWRTGSRRLMCCRRVCAS